MVSISGFVTDRVGDFSLKSGGWKRCLCWSLNHVTPLHKDNVAEDWCKTAPSENLSKSEGGNICPSGQLATCFCEWGFTRLQPHLFVSISLWLLSPDSPAAEMSSSNRDHMAPYRRRLPIPAKSEFSLHLYIIASGIILIIGKRTFEKCILLASKRK